MGQAVAIDASGERLATQPSAYVKEQAAAVLAAMEPSQPPPAPTVPVDLTPAYDININDLPPDKQQEMLQALQQYRAGLQAKPAAAGTPVIPAASTRVTATPVPPAPIEIPQPPPTAASAAAPDTAPPDAVATHVAVSDAGSAATPQFCPRCLWDIKAPFMAQPTDRDKENFLAAFLGGKRFQQRVNFMGGRFTVVFRALTCAETNLLFQQLGHDVRAGRIAGDGEYVMAMQNYRLAMGVARIEADTTILHEVGNILDVPYTAPPGEPQTVLVPFTRWFHDTIIPQESILRVVAQAHRQFQRLVERLEAMAQSPDFWTGISD